VKASVKITKRGAKIRKKVYKSILKRHGPEGIADLMKAAGQEIALRKMVADGVPFKEAAARQGLHPIEAREWSPPPGPTGEPVS
jgi:hypothetical protein